MKSLQFEIPHGKIAAFCRKHHLLKLSFFRWILRDGINRDSDIDVLVEFEPEHIPGLAFFRMQEELSEILGHNGDLNTRNFLSRYFRDQVLSEAEELLSAA